MHAINIPPTVRQKLLSAGITSPAEVLSMSGCVDLAHEAGITVEEARAVIKAIKGPEGPASQIQAQSTQSSLGKTALEILTQEMSSCCITTRSEGIDAMLHGGVPLGKITEFCGIPGVGKTQMGMQLAITVQIPKLYGGLEGECVYLDTEGSFSVDRIKEMASALIAELSSLPDKSAVPTLDKILSSIYLFRVNDCIQQIAMTHILPSFLQEHPNVRLIVVDSVSFHWRNDFQDMALRTRLLVAMAQSFLQLATKYNLAVVFTSQVTTRIYGKNKTPSLVAALGESWAHMSTNRIDLFLEGGERRAFLFKSPYCAQARTQFNVYQQGIC
ncbi:Rad51 DNA recombinase 3 [Pelomyxa schiedti]|nr:Rad51 DNA recombinase 3 [Pelomyxa schiedti]